MYRAVLSLFLVVSALVDIEAARAQSQISLRFEVVAEDYAKPTFIANAGDGSGLLYVSEKPGYIQIIQDGEKVSRPFLNIKPIVRSKGNEQGLLGFAFHPDYKTNGYVFVDYTDLNGDVVVARYSVSDEDPDAADPESGEILLTIPKPYDDHNAGQLAFGPDGYLYIGVGDGGAKAEPKRNAQNTQVLLGKILRIDVNREADGKPYAIPADNPFVDSDSAQPEIWAYGLRNPWRFSFDRQTGDLYIADVGLWSSEEVNVQPAGDKGGLNYGWNIVEGEICHDLDRANRCESDRLIDPVFIYHHEMGCAIVGGYVYRGAAIPELAGRYIFGDYCMGRVWTIALVDGTWVSTEPLETGFNISTFGQDESGELYLADLRGTIYRIVAG